MHRDFLQLRLLSSHARVVFSPALNMYFAEPNVTTIEGSVSEEAVVTTAAVQSIGEASRERWTEVEERPRWDEIKYLQCRRLRPHSIPASLKTASEKDKLEYSQSAR